MTGDFDTFDTSTPDIPGGPGLVSILHKPTGACLIRFTWSIREEAKRWPRALRNPDPYRYVPPPMKEFIHQHGHTGWVFEHGMGAGKADADRVNRDLRAQGVTVFARPRGRPSYDYPAPMTVIGRIIGRRAIPGAPKLDIAVGCRRLDDTMPPISDELMKDAAGYNTHFIEFVFTICWDGEVKNANPSPDVIAALWKIWRASAVAIYPERTVPMTTPLTLADALTLPDWGKKGVWRRKKY
jgi:hypothetical protein